MFLGLRHTHRVNSSPQPPTEGCHAKLYLCCFASIDRQAVRSERYRLTRCLCLQEFSFHTLELDYSRSESAERQKNNYTSLFGFVAVEQKSFFFFCCQKWLITRLFFLVFWLNLWSVAWETPSPRNKVYIILIITLTVSFSDIVEHLATKETGGDQKLS